MLISVLLAALSMVGVIYQVVSRANAWRAPGSLTVRSVRNPREILKAALPFFLEGGWTLRARSTDAETFSYALRPAGPEVLVLLLLGVLPGLLYLLAGRRTVTVIVTSHADGPGSVTLVSWSNSGECEQTCRDFASMIRSQEPRLGDSRPRGRIRRSRSVGSRAAARLPHREGTEHA